LFKFVLLKKFLLIIGVGKLSNIAVLGGGLKTTSLGCKKYICNYKYLFIKGNNMRNTLPLYSIPFRMVNKSQHNKTK